MSPPVLIDVKQMIDLALGTPELGVVNFNVLHSLLHVMARELHIHDTRVELRGSGTQVIRNLMSSSRPSVDVLVSQYTIQRESKSKSSTNLATKTQRETTNGTLKDNVSKRDTKGEVEDDGFISDKIEKVTDREDTIQKDTAIEETVKDSLKDDSHETESLLERDLREDRSEGEVPEKSLSELDTTQKLPSIKVSTSSFPSKELPLTEDAQSHVVSKIHSDEDVEGDTSLKEEVSAVVKTTSHHSTADSTVDGDHEKIIVVERVVSDVEQPSQAASSVRGPSAHLDVPSVGRGSEGGRSSRSPHLAVVTVSRYRLLEEKVNRVEYQLKDMHTRDKDILRPIKQMSGGSRTSMVESWHGLQAGARLQALEEATAHVCGLVEDLSAKLRQDDEPEEDEDGPKTVFEKLAASAEETRKIRNEIKSVEDVFNNFKDRIIDELKLDIPEDERNTYQKQIDELKDELMEFYTRNENENSENKKQINLFQDQLCYFEKEVTEMWKKLCENKKRKYSQQSLPDVDLGKLGTIQDDLENLHHQILTIQEEKDSKDQHIHILFEEVEVLKKQKASHTELEDALRDKVEQPAVNRKVSVDQFDAAFASLARCCAAASSQAATQSQAWTSALQELQQTMVTKLSKQDLEGFAGDVYAQLAKLQERVKQLREVRQEPEAAGVKSRFIRNVNCISCNKSAIMNKFNDGELPLFKAVPPHTMLRLHPKLNNNARGVPDTIHEWAYHLQKEPNKSPGHLVSRYCGGSYTTTTAQQRVLRGGNFLTQWGLQAKHITHSKLKGNLTSIVCDVCKNETKSGILNEEETGHPVTPKTSKVDVESGLQREISKTKIVTENVAVQTVKQADSREETVNVEAKEDEAHPQLSTHEIVKSDTVAEETDKLQEVMSSKKSSQEMIEDVKEMSTTSSKKSSKENIEGFEELAGSKKSSKERIEGVEELTGSKKSSKEKIGGVEELTGSKKSSIENVEGDEEMKGSKKSSKEKIESVEELTGSKKSSKERIESVEELTGSKKSSKEQIEGVEELTGSKKSSKENVEGDEELAGSKKSSKEKIESFEELTGSKKSSQGKIDDNAKEMSKISSKKSVVAVEHISHQEDAQAGHILSQKNSSFEVHKDSSKTSSRMLQSPKNSFAEIVKRFSGNVEEGSLKSPKKPSSQVLVRRDSKEISAAHSNTQVDGVLPQDNLDASRKSKSRKSSTASRKKRSSKSRDI